MKEILIPLPPPGTEEEKQVMKKLMDIISWRKQEEIFERTFTTTQMNIGKRVPFFAILAKMKSNIPAPRNYRHKNMIWR